MLQLAREQGLERRAATADRTETETGTGQEGTKNKGRENRQAARLSHGFHKRGPGGRADEAQDKREPS